MNSFFKTFLASLLAFVVANILIAVFLVVIFASFVAATFSTKTVQIDSESILKIDLSEPIYDNPPKGPIYTIDFTSMTVQNRLSMIDVLNAIERASIDPDIQGIYINVDPYVGISTARLDEIRQAILKFKESGKFVISYANQYSQGSYYLATAADNVYLNPEGGLSWVGLAINTMFFKGALEKLDIQPEVIRHGQFKSAVEPFILDKMSPENREQMNMLVGTIWNNILKNVSEARGIDTVTLNRYATELTVTDAESARETKMVDDLLYYNDVNNILCELSGVEDEPQFITLGEYARMPLKHVGRLSKNKIAVVYAEGDIVDGKGSEEQIGGESLSAKLADMREDDDVKAVVLRINSGGGSALASEVIWHEMELLREQKPVIVSMGDYAASGGYYIAAPADVIMASPYTITGSIGVFGLMFNAEKSFKDKLGITFDVAKTNPSADLGRAVFGFAGVRPMTEYEKNMMQKEVERVYNTFVKHVADGRNLTVEQVDKIGGGRVWSGVSAAQIGLIDGFGGLKEAIAVAADRAGVAHDYRVVSPHQKQDSFSQILNMLSEANAGKLLENRVEGDIVENYQYLINMLQRPGVQAVLPYKIDIQ